MSKLCDINKKVCYYRKEFNVDTLSALGAEGIEKISNEGKEVVLTTHFNLLEKYTPESLLEEVKEGNKHLDIRYSSDILGDSITRKETHPIWGITVDEDTITLKRV